MKNQSAAFRRIINLMPILFLAGSIILGVVDFAFAANCKELKIDTSDKFDTPKTVPLYKLNATDKKFVRIDVEKAPSKFPNPLVLKDCGHKKFLAWDTAPEVLFIEKVRVTQICVELAGSIHDGSSVAGSPGAGDANNCSAKD